MLLPAYTALNLAVYVGNFTPLHSALALLSRATPVVKCTQLGKLSETACSSLFLLPITLLSNQNRLEKGLREKEYERDTSGFGEQGRLQAERVPAVSANAFKDALFLTPPATPLFPSPRAR